MSNTKKTYTIEIQLDAAKQALADTNQKLTELDKKLEGLDRNFDAAKAIVAEMAKLAKQAEAAEAELSGLSTRLDGLKPGSLPALRAQVEELEEALNQTTRGTKEFDEALLALGNAKGELKAIEDAVDALDPKMKAAAFVDFANGVVGAYAVASTAAQAFGVSSDTVQEYEQRLLSCIAVLDGMEQVSRALNSETLSVVKSALASGKAWLTAGESASAGAKVTRAALISTGIGAVVVLVGLLIANWDRLTASVKGSEAFFTRFKAIVSGLFESAVASAKNFAGVIGKLFDGNFSGAAAKARNIGKEMGEAYSKGYEESLFEGYKKTIERTVTYNEQLLKIQQASGRDTYELQRRILQDKYILLDKSAADFKKQETELLGDLAALNRAEEVRRKKATLDAVQARLDGVAALEAAKGEDAFQAQLKAKRSQLAALQAAAQPNAAAIISKQAEIDALIIQHDQQTAEKKRAALVLAQAEVLALEEKQGKDTLDLRLKFAEQLLALDRDGTEKERAQRDADYQALLLLEVEYNNREKAIRDANREDERAEQGRLAEERNAFNAAAGQGALDVMQRANDEAKRTPSLGATILEKFFGVSSEDSERIKGELSAAFASLRDVAVGFASDLLSEGISAMDAQIQATRDRLSEIDQQLQASRSAAEDTASQLAQSDGAKRDYLLQKLAKERAEVERLAAAKKKAAADEKKQQDERAKLEKQQQQLVATTTLVTNVSTAASAVSAGVSAVAGAAKLPFPASVPAIVAALAAVIGAVASARSLAATFADGTGSLGSGVAAGRALGADYILRGPRHSGGGVALFSRSGHYWGEAEGGEAITPVDATQKNAAALELIRTAGRTRTLTPADFMAQQAGSIRVLPPPSGHFANGGVLPNGAAPDEGATGATAGGGSGMAARLDVLEKRSARTNELLEQVVAHAADTARSNDYIARKPPIGREEALELRKMAEEVDMWEKMATL